ncbi:MAG: DUF4340 domain-containing protein [Planctomycetota bacterium]|jgi:hypothetical protein|nr:DUF4340 domain-containing protein [Planctomycetota bacterium]
MKFRNCLVAAAALALIVLTGLNFKPKPPGGPAKPTGATNAPEPASPELAPAAASHELAPESVDELAISSPGGVTAVKLRKVEGAWRVATLEESPADESRMERLLADVFAAFAAPRIAGGVNLSQAGLSENQGVTVVVRDSRMDREKALRVGLSPTENPGETYVMAADGSVSLVRSDLRGDLGLRENIPSPPLDAEYLRRRTAFTAALGDVTKIDFEDGRQKLVLQKTGEIWKLAEGGPKDGQDGLNAAAVRAWVKALSWFIPGELALPGSLPAQVVAGQSGITVHLADGSAATLSAGITESGSILARASSTPGLVYRMPEWRFERYFRRFFDIFPGSDPRFKAGEVRFADLRRDGGSVKFALRDGTWSAVGFSFPLRLAEVRRWVAAVSRWLPGDFVQNPQAARIPQDAPTVEIILASGEVRQYRLGGETADGGRHVLVDGADLFVTDGETAAALFPRAARLFYLGALFLDVDPDHIAEAFISRDGMDRARIWRDESGAVNIGIGDAVSALKSEAAKTWLDNLLHWRITGIYEGAAQVFDAPKATIRFIVDGVERSLVLGSPADGEYPALRDNRDAYLVDGGEVDAWLAALRDALPSPSAAPAADPAAPRDDASEAAPDPGAIDAARPVAPESPEPGEGTRHPEPENLAIETETETGIETETETAADAGQPIPFSGATPPAAGATVYNIDAETDREHDVASEAEPQAAKPQLMESGR